MSLGGVAAHNYDEIGIFNVSPGIRHCATAKRRSQTGHRRAVSNTGLVVEDEHARATHHLIGEVGRLVSRRRSSEISSCYPAIDGHAVFVRGNEILIAVVLHKAGDAV